jgi:hypothetical protein
MSVPPSWPWPGDDRRRKAGIVSVTQQAVGKLSVRFNAGWMRVSQSAATGSTLHYMPHESKTMRNTCSKTASRTLRKDL